MSPRLVTKSATSRELALALSGRETWAERELLVRYTRHVERTIMRITGSLDLDDAVQEVFVRVLDRIRTLRDGDSLPGFVTQIAVFVARECLRARRRRRWLVFLAPDEVPEVLAPVASDELRAALGSFYALVERLDPDERIPFLLRHVEGMELTEVANACAVSLATAKRRLAAAERIFRRHAADAPDLERWVATSAKWVR